MSAAGIARHHLSTGRLEPDPLHRAPRLVFANQLRGLAAVSVMLSHLFAVYWWVRGFVAVSLAMPPQTGPVPAFTRIADNPWFQPGPFGVALFFLISGLVIPFSLDRHRGAGFLAARALRIYPTYMAALAIEVGVLHLNGWFWHRPVPFGTETILANAFLVQNLFGLPAVDLVNWSLCIEIKFYLLMLLLAPLIRRGLVFPVVATAFGLVAFSGLLRAVPIGAALEPARQALRLESVYLVFMLTGTLFALHVRSRLGSPGLAAAAALVLGLFVFCWRIGPQTAQFPLVLFDYGYAFVLFALCFLARRWIRPIRLLDRLADISYPLYLLHSVVGMSVITLMTMRFGWSGGTATLAALAVIAPLVILLHLATERPSIRAGRALARGQDKRGRAKAAAHELPRE